MSTRRTITQAIKTALGTVTGVSAVTDRAELWFNAPPQKLPMLLVEDEVVAREFTTYPDATLNDMKAEMEVSIACRAYSLAGTPDSNADTVLGGVETKMNGPSTAISSSILAVFPVDDVTEEGMEQGYAHWRARFRVLYMYNHLSP